MEIKIHEVNNTKIAEVISDKTVINDAADGLDLMGSLYSHEADKMIVHQQNIAPAFFDLKTGIAGEILQKFSTYRVRLAITGDFTIYPGKSLRDFIFESNKQGQIYFVASTQEAIDKLAQHA